jgi:ABC-type antimicrobial peptide transport system permease subunit
MTTVVAFTSFLFLFANTLLDVTSAVTSVGLSSPLGVLYDAFIWTTLVLVLILGAVVVSSTVSLEMVSRRKDIGLMKSIGTLMDTLFDHFMAQAVILLLASIVLGIACGTLMYLGGMMWLAYSIPNLQFTFNYPLLQIGEVALVYLFVGFFAAQKPIYDAVQESPISAMSPDTVVRQSAPGFLYSFGLSFRMASKATGRRIKGSRRVLVSLFLSVCIASLLWVGGGVVQGTTDAYVARAMGNNVIAIGNSTMLSEYYGVYSLQGSPLNNSITLLDSPYIVPSHLIEQLASAPGVVQVESRLVVSSSVKEGPAIIWNPTLSRYERIGNDRVSHAILVGVNWSHTISSWYYEGDPVSKADEVWIGGKMATSMYVDPLVQTLQVRGASLSVMGIAFDVLNGGMVAMMDLSSMQSLWNVSGVNLVLVQLYSYDESYISQIRTMANAYGLDIYRQQDVLLGNERTIGGIWLLMQPLPIMALFSAFLNLMYFLLVSVFGRFRDYIIMRSVGAKPSFVAKTMVAEGLGLGLKAGVPAALLASLFSIYGLIPDATIPSLLYLPEMIVLILLSLVGTVLLASIPVYLIFKGQSGLRVSEFAT